MAEHWKEGDPVPEGLRSDTTLGAAVMAVIGALAARSGVLSTEEMSGLFDDWAESLGHNSAENNAGLVLAVATLAAGAYLKLASLEGANPVDLVKGDAVVAEVLASMVGGGNER